MTLFMIHAPLDLRSFNAWAGSRGLMQRGGFDEGVALHRLLAALFGKGTVQPFRLFSPRRGVNGSFYAYSTRDHRALADEASTVGTSDDLRVLPPETLRSKPMPDILEPGRRLGFDVRVRPVRRSKKVLTDPQALRNPKIKAGAELDAFRLEALIRFPYGHRDPEDCMAAAGKSREAVYGAWLAERLDPAARIESLRLAGFQRRRVLRNRAWTEGPDAILQGTLLVDAPDQLVALLRNGVGRHKAYGYGMLILRPPDRAPMNR